MLIKWKIAKHMLTINIQDDGKTTYQNSEDTRYRERFPFLYRREYSQTTRMLGPV